jgi:hypothetical protein
LPAHCRKENRRLPLSSALRLETGGRRPGRVCALNLYGENQALELASAGKYALVMPAIGNRINESVSRFG